MKKQFRRILFLGCMVASVWLGGVAADAQKLREDLVRLHVVANSDSQEDQAVKLQVRDAVLATLEQGLSDVKDANMAAEYIRTMLPKLTAVANEALAKAGFSETATVDLAMEQFPLRHYDTFSLPSGIYRAVRVVIGDGQGHNWWCVAFPQLCLSATSEEFAQVAQTEGMSPELAGALTGEYEIRFWVLDQMGKIGNFLWGDSE